MTEILSIRFGKEGDCRDYLGEGWTRPEPGLTWTVGRRATLLLPKPLVPIALLVSLRAHPFRPVARPFQRVVASVDGQLVGRMLLTEADDFRFWIPKDVVESAGDPLILSLDLPDAGRPADFDGSADDRMLGLSCHHLTVEEPLSLDEDETPLSAVAAAMESLGRNCEFGLVQRRAGVEPLGLLRFATSPMSALMAGLESRFEGFGAADRTEIVEAPLADSDEFEWMVRDHRFGFVFHTFTRTNEMTREEAIRRELRRLPFLARKLIEDLENAEKLFVYQAAELASPGAAEPLLHALRRYGDNTLMLVMADPARAGEVELTGRGLMLGCVSELTPLAAANRLNWRDWSRILRHVQQRWPRKFELRA